MSRVRAPSPALVVAGCWIQSSVDDRCVGAHVARIAQSVEHILGKDEVIGSIPIACSEQVLVKVELLLRTKVMPREKIILACGECKNRNYFTTKNKRTHPERVEWKKYCPRCDKHQVHKETK